jgi:hypothetical protein
MNAERTQGILSAGRLPNGFSDIKASIMSAPAFTRYIRHAVVLAAAGCLLAATAYGEEAFNLPLPAVASSLTAATTGLPPMEQALVPEGVFAVRLAEALKLGRSPDEAQAESLLGSLGITPANGWITDYPVTPAVLGDIEKSLAEAAEQGKLGFGKRQALALLAEVEKALGLDVTPNLKTPAGPVRKPENRPLYRYTDGQGEIHYTDDYNAIPEAYRSSVKILNPPAPPGVSDLDEGLMGEAPPPEYTANPDSGTVEEYFDVYGPPVVTYYSPPVPYDYLYTWTPYPFWSAGFYFPGFFVLNDFHRPVFLGRHRYFVSRHSGGNKYRYPWAERSLKTSPGGFRQSGPTPPRHGFYTPSARAGAQAIVSRTGSRRDRNRSAAPQMQSAERPSASKGSFSGSRSRRPQIIRWNSSPQATQRSGGSAVAPSYRSRDIANRRINPRQEERRLSGGNGRERQSFGQGIRMPQNIRAAPLYRQERILQPPRTTGRSMAPATPGRGSFEGFRGGAGFGTRGSGSFGGGARSGARR